MQAENTNAAKSAGWCREKDKEKFFLKNIYL